MSLELTLWRMLIGNYHAFKARNGDPFLHLRLSTKQDTIQRSFVAQGPDECVRSGQHLQAGEVPGVQEGLHAALVSLQHCRL